MSLLIGKYKENKSEKNIVEGGGEGRMLYFIKQNHWRCKNCIDVEQISGRKNNV